MKLFCSILFLLAAPLFAFPQDAPQPTITLPPDVARVLTDYENAWNKNDPAALAQLFAEDGMVLSGGAPAVRGRAAIERIYTGPNKRPVSLRAFAFGADGNSGFIIGGFSDHLGEPDRGKFTLTLRREASGRWLIMSDMDNGNRPPPPPPVCPPENKPTQTEKKP